MKAIDAETRESFQVYMQFSFLFVNLWTQSSCGQIDQCGFKRCHAIFPVPIYCDPLIYTLFSPYGVSHLRLFFNTKLQM